MPHVCPRLCGRLATAAIFISVGVVQLMAGLILIRSDYVYLLAPLNFWTAASNIAVGSVLGVSANVWKETQKKSSKHTTRRNLLASLVLSSILMNVTTSTILILGEGNALLSIGLENKGIHSSVNLGNELLAYAYATSVCSPIICIVVAIIFLSGLCFRRKEKKVATPEIKSILKKGDSHVYSWVFRPKRPGLPQPDLTIMRRALSTKFLSSSTEDDSFNSTDITDLYRSNSIPSVDGVENSLHSTIGRIRARSHNDVFHQSPNHQSEEHRTADSSDEKHRVSFADVSLKGRRILRNLRLPRSQHSKIRKHFNLEDYETETGIWSEFKPNDQNSPRQLKFSTKPIPVEHIRNEICCGRQSDLGIYRAPLISQSQPNVKTCAGKKISVTADVHVNARNSKSCQNFPHYNDSQKESTLVYEADTSSSNVFGRSNESEYDCANAQIRRTSTARSLNSLKAIDETNGHKTVRRTSTAISSNSPDGIFITEDSKNDSTFEPIESHEDSVILRPTSSEVLYSLVRTSPPEESNLNSTMEIIDASFDTSGMNCLAGEVVPIRINDSFPRKLSSKLIPVSIPLVSGVKKQLLSATKTSDTINLKSTTENHRRADPGVGTNKFDGNREAKFSSFKGGIKPKAKRNRRRKTTVACPRKQQEIRSGSITPEPTTSCRTEDQARENSPSSAQTSGYISAQEETLESTGISDSTSKMSILSSATSAEGRPCVSRTAPRKKYHISDKTSQSIWASPESNAIKEMVCQIVGEDSKMSSKKQLIDQLLNDAEFQKKKHVQERSNRDSLNYTTNL